MILKNISLLYGHELKLINSTSVKISDSKFKEINSQITRKNDNVVDCENLLLIPGFINAHTHIGDSIAKDLSINSNARPRSLQWLLETSDIKKAVTDSKSGQVEIKNDKDGNIGLSLGRKSFSDDKLLKNFNAVVETFEKEKRNNSKPQ